MAQVTRDHRLAVARAWEGDGPPAGGQVQRWAEAGTVIGDDSARFERLAQLVADAEGKLHRAQDYCGRIYGHSYVGAECADCLFPKPPEQP